MTRDKNKCAPAKIIIKIASDKVTLTTIIEGKEHFRTISRKDLEKRLNGKS